MPCMGHKRASVPNMHLYKYWYIYGFSEEPHMRTTAENPNSLNMYWNFCIDYRVTHTRTQLNEHEKKKNLHGCKIC